MHEVGSFKLKVAINICPWLDEFLSVWRVMSSVEL
jgi:hypothetical protein